MPSAFDSAEFPAVRSGSVAQEPVARLDSRAWSFQGSVPDPAALLDYPARVLDVVSTAAFVPEPQSFPRTKHWREPLF